MTGNAHFYSIGRLYISVHNKIPPSDAEWDVLLRMIETIHPNARAIIFTDGGAPSAPQRKSLSEAFAGRVVPTAVISDSLIPRFVNASIALFNKSIRSYSSQELEEACRYLELTAEERQQMAQTLKQILAAAGDKRFQTVSVVLQSVGS